MWPRMQSRSLLLLLVVSAPAARVKDVGLRLRHRQERPSHAQHDGFLGGGVDSARCGLLVGTERGETNVISDFGIMPTWESGEDPAAVAGIAEPFASFYISAGESLILVNISVNPAHNMHAQPHLRGALVDLIRSRGRALLRPGDTWPVIVGYGCVSAGDVSLTLELQLADFTTVQIPWKKSCGGVPNESLNVVGDLGEHVVQRGKPLWDQRRVIGTGVRQSSFAISVDSLSNLLSEEISVPRVSSHGSCKVEMSSPIKSGMRISPTISAKTVVKYGCVRRGICIVSMDVPFIPDMAPYLPLRWQWTKMCDGVAPGIDVKVGVIEADGSHAGPAGSLALAEGGVLLVSDGVSKALQEDCRVGAGTPKNQVMLVNDKQRSLTRAIDVLSLRVNCIDEHKCIARLAQPQPSFLSSEVPVTLDVEYTCQSSGSSMVQLTLETAGHDPVVAMWHKDCTMWSDTFVGTMSVAFLACTLAAGVSLGCVQLCQEKKLNKSNQTIAGETQVA